MNLSFGSRGRSAASALRRGLAGVGAALALTLAIAPSPAHATGTRAWNLGVMNRFILDDANRWLFPHTITKYGNLFYIELYGLSDSFGSTAPTSMRGMRDTTGSMLSAADVVPVQGTAGGGAILSLTDDLFVSFHLSDYENPTVRAFLAQMVAAGNIVAGDPNTFGWVNTGRMPNPVSDANRKLDMFVAYNVADLLSLGLQLTLGSSSYSYTPNAGDGDLLTGDDQLRRAPDDLGASEFRFLLSAGMDLSESLAIDVGFGMGFHGITYRPNQRADLLDGGGGLELQFDVRSMIGLTEWWELVPAVSIRTLALSAADLGAFDSGLSFNRGDNENGGNRQTANITDIAVSSFLLDIGVAGHFKPNDIVQFWGALGFQMQRRSFQYDHFNQDNPGTFDRTTPGNSLEYLRDSQAFTALPYMRLALEARVFSWLDFRGGVVKYVRGDTNRHEQEDLQDTNQNQDNDYSDDQPFFDYFVGAAVHYEGFFLDMQMDPLWFKRGPDFLSGSGGNMFINGSLGYRFN